MTRTEQARALRAQANLLVGPHRSGEPSALPASPFMLAAPVGAYEDANAGAR